MESMNSPNLWISLFNIILVNIVLSGDNAIVIALAAHGLPLKQQKPAILFGSIAAILMRTILTIFAVSLLNLPYLKMIGGILLFGIAIKLALQRHKTGEVEAHSTIAAAVKTILLADVVMSLDNVLGVAAAAHGNLVLLIIGLIFSVPLIVFGSTLVLKVMQKFPLVAVLGATILAYLGGEMAFSDVAIHSWIKTNLPNENIFVPSTVWQLNIPGLVAAVMAIMFGMFRLRDKSRIK